MFINYDKYEKFFINMQQFYKFGNVLISEVYLGKLNYYNNGSFWVYKH